MRYLVATLGALFVLIGGFVLTAVLFTACAPALLVWTDTCCINTNNPYGLALSLLAAISSFLATLRLANRKTLAGPAGSEQTQRRKDET